MTITNEMWIGFAIKTSPLWFPALAVTVLALMVEHEDKVERLLFKIQQSGAKRWL